MALHSGSRLGPYEITAQIGTGGMGVVYRARDTRLQRDVAIKVLPDALAADPDRLARFQREAQVLASLNHPNIAAIYGLEEGPDALDSARAGEAGRHVRALVLELVEGETLADRIARGPIPIDEALPIASCIVEALEAAHEAGVVHRDLKPANIKITPGGQVKVLDFGLAKLTQTPGPGPAASELTALPTLTSPALMTGVGMILGTAAYMSPEQARGRPVDRRADIWAFGCVLYEMVTGTRAFEEEDISLTLSKILRLEPNLAALPVETPPTVRQTLRLCLRKDQRERLQAAGDIRLLLGGALEPSAAPAAPASFFWRRWLVGGLAGLLLGGLTAGLTVWRLRPAPTAPVSRVTMILQAGQRLAGLELTAIALSPDGSRLVYVATAGGSQQLYVRERDRFESRPIAGTEGATSPFFSPDGQWVAFFTVDRLKKVAISGGPPVTLARVDNFGRGGSWDIDGTIVFAARFDGGLSLISAAGGAVRPLTTVDRQKATFLAERSPA